MASPSHSPPPLPAQSIKLVLCGDSAVGKSSLISRYARDEFSDTVLQTVGVEFVTKIVAVRGADARIQLFDLAGQERYRAVTKSVFRGSKGALLVYDITRRGSFDSIPAWLDTLQAEVGPTCCVILVGNKCDREGERQVSREEADTFARAHGLSFLETSAKDRTNVERAFVWLVNSIVDTTPLPSMAPSSKPPPAVRQPVLLSGKQQARAGGGGRADDGDGCKC